MNPLYASTARTAPKVPGANASAMSVGRPAIKHGKARLRRDEPLVINVKGGVGMVGGAGRMDLSAPAGKAKAARLEALRAAIECGDREAANSCLRQAGISKAERRSLLTMAGLRK